MPPVSVIGALREIVPVGAVRLKAGGSESELPSALAPDVQRSAGTGWKKDAGFHHSFTTSKPRESGRHGEKSGASQPGAPGTSEHDKP